MEEKSNSKDYSIEALKERAKELNCLYQVEEYLNNKLLSLPEIFEGIIRVIPNGWQFPEFCQARITYENCCYQTNEYFISPWSEGCNIKVDDKLVGNIEVSYIKEVPKHEEGFFLEKERKLIRTIADRIGQTILKRQMEKILHEWEIAKRGLPENRDSNNEWVVIVNLLRRIDQGTLSHICRKMINHLFLIDVPEAIEILQNSNSNKKAYVDFDILNISSTRQPLDNILNISDKAFDIASRYMSDSEITTRIKKWIREEKVYNLISEIDRVDASVNGIINTINHNKNITEDMDMLYSPTERSLKVSLIHRFLSDKSEYVNVAKQYIEVCDFFEIVNKIIFPIGSRGRLGGKSAGLFLAQQILKKEEKNLPILGSVRVPKTWYITTDEIIDFLHYNNLQELNEHKYKSLTEIRIDYPHVVQLMKNSHFSPEIIKSLSVVLDYFGNCPLIVRSSSHLEDQMGAAFSGKYKSIFLANQGSKQMRLEFLMDAVIEVYSSIFNPDSIQYRSERGLLDFNEEMGIMIQEVVGTRICNYFLPVFAGVAFSNNEFHWSPKIKREDGLVRLVPGLGTRAVDRLGDDFPILISPGQPGLRVNSTAEEIKRYSPKKIDVINLEKNVFETIEVSSFIKEYGDLIPNINEIISVNDGNDITNSPSSDINFIEDDLVITFEGLISETPFIKQINTIVKTLQEKMNTPVDIEFASNGHDFYLLQCRPQSFAEDILPSPIPKDIDKKEIIFSADRYISNGRTPDISYIIYVDPNKYNNLYYLDLMAKVGRAVGLLNNMLPKRQFILMGPGRWGSRGDLKMGVPVGYADLNNAAVLIEIALKKSNYAPELSFGTHFFQDLVEANIRYLPLYPDDEGIIFNERFLQKSKNLLTSMLPQFKDLEDTIRVIDIPMSSDGKVLKISMNAELGEALGYLSSPTAAITDPEIPIEYNEPRYSDDFWRWRHYMAEHIAAKLDSKRFGVKAMYLFGSTNNTSAGPGSDIDLLIHFAGTDEQRAELLFWLEGWSLCLDEMNYLKTGYSSRGLLDVHIVTDEDIAKKAPYANKIGSIMDPAHPLKIS